MSNVTPLTPAAAFMTFLSSFGVPVYAASAVPSEATYPYMTFLWVHGEWEKGEVNIQTNLYYYTDSEAVPNAKVKQIYDGIGMGGVLLPCDGGHIWVKRGSPFAQTVVDENDKIKRRLINISVEFDIS